MTRTGGSGIWRRVAVRLLGGTGELRGRLLGLYGLLLGALGGLAEAMYLTVRHYAVHRPAAWYFPEMIWMAPLAAGLTGALIALALGIVARAAHSGVAIGKATFVLVLPGIYGVAQSRGIPLHPAAEVILAIGLAGVAMRAAHRWHTSLTRLVRRSALPVAIVLAALASYGAANLPRVVERRALLNLPSASPGSPNILMIILDTVRAPNLGLYGYDRATSPNLDRWSASGIVFERAVATAPWTLPSHASMFTGRYNFEIGTSFTQPMDAGHPVLAELLARRGYATAGFVANLSYTSRASGLHRGFARYEDFPVTPAMFTRSAWLPGKLSGVFTLLTGLWRWQVPKSAGHLTDEFEGWIERRPDRPFFVFLNYFDAHDPYESPPPWRSRFGPPPVGDLSDDRQYTTEEVGPWLDAYDGAIAYLDDQLARVFATLENRGLRENTLVIVTSDHGEMFGERGQIHHTNGLYTPALHVPLIMSFPGVVPAGVRVGGPVTLRDLPATILDLAGFGSDTGIPGTSLVRSGDGGPNVSSRSPILAELDFQGGVAAWKPINRGHMKSLIEGAYHYIHNGNGVEELYDAVTDPAATDDLAGREGMRPTVERFRAALAALFVTLEAGG
jgi:arylsulfatase A-like enzyme